MAMLPMMDMIPLTPDLKPMVLGIMNEKYPHALGMYVRYYGKKSHCQEAKLSDVTETGFEVSYKDDAGEAAVCKLSFLAVPDETEITCSTVGGARRAFVEMARHAAEKLGETIDLPPPSDPPSAPDGPAGNPMEAMMAMMAMMEAKGKGKGTDGNADGGDPMASFMSMLKGKGKGAGGEAATAPVPGGASGNVRTLHSSSSSGDPMAEMMAQMMAAKGKGKGAPAAPVDPWANLGAGNRLDGRSASAAEPEPVMDTADLAAQVRPVDPDAPTLKLRVRLPDKKQVTLTFNGCHTIGQVRAFLQVNHADAFSGPYSLMDTGGFPPKKLADLSQRLDEAGVKNGSSLDCRKS
mmetsp:Transcript_94995/g.167723  ORF Transcript_94995/g.167723 Transcript_94995/m.167723 type:complete len:350 (+) Transcript_94995:58-1107(+)